MTALAARGRELGAARTLNQAEAGAPAASPLYAPPPQDVRRLRVALVSTPKVSSWIVSMLELAAASRWIDIQVLPIDVAWSPSTSSLPLDMRAFMRLDRWLLRCFLRMTGRRDESPLSRVRIDAAGRDASAQTAAEFDIDSLRPALRALQPDLVLLHGPQHWAGSLAGCATHGCWVLDETLVDHDRAGAALLEPIMAKQDASAITLQLQRAGVAPLVLSESWSATRAVSFTQNRDNAFLKLPAMLLRALRNLATGSCPASGAEVGRLCLAEPTAAFRAGAGLRALWITLRLMRGLRKRRRCARQPWFVVLREDADAIDPAAPRLGVHRVLIAPGADYWADPFPLCHEGRQWLFVEEFVAATGKGVISCLELQADGTAVRHGVVLEEPFHLSFPQVWRGPQCWYMTVESADGGKACLYRSEDLLDGWRCISDLLHGRNCVDPTLFQHEGNWYLFVNVSESGGNPSDELFLFTSSQVAGPYRPHPANPIVSDARSARMAGQVFVDARGRLIRPAQCCAPIYGTAVVFNQITELSQQAYAERTLSRLDADWMPGLDGCHTYYRDGNLEVLDAHGEPPSKGRVRLVDVAQAAGSG